MNSFTGLVIFVMLFLVNCPEVYGQQNSLATQRRPKQSSDSVTREPEPFCPPKEIRDERYCPDKQSRVNAHRDCSELMKAAEGGDIDEVRALLRNGADVNEARGSVTALMLAAGRDHLQMVQTLLRAGANPNAIVFGRYGIPGWAWMFAMNRCNKHWREMTEAMLQPVLSSTPRRSIGPLSVMRFMKMMW